MHVPFDLSAQGGLDLDDIRALRESVATTLAKECDSRALHDFIDGRSDLDATLWQQAADLGWLAIALPAERAGLGLGVAGIQLLCRELGACVAPGAFIPAICGLAWLSHVSGDSAASLIETIIAGKVQLAIPTRVGAEALRADESGVSGTVELLGDGASAVAIVPVSGGWALIDLANAVIETPEMWDRTRMIIRATFDDADTVARFADPDGTAGELLSSLFAIALAADSIGAAEAIAGKTIAYLKDRVQFERPIASFQAIKHRAANLVTIIATQESLLEQATESLDLGSPGAAMWARLAKAGASEAAAFITGDCIALHGGVGHTWDYDPHIYAKRARLDQFLLADNGELRSESMRALMVSVTEDSAVTEIFA